MCSTAFTEILFSAGFSGLEQAGLVEKRGTSDESPEEFYRLLVITRRRHHVPPPPYAWFQNLIRCQGKALEIRLAYQNETPIAAILTLRFRDIVYYKYGCSDARFNKFGAMPWLLWKAISAAKSKEQMSLTWDALKQRTPDCSHSRTIGSPSRSDWSIGDFQKTPTRLFTRPMEIQDGEMRFFLHSK